MKRRTFFGTAITGTAALQTACKYLPAASETSNTVGNFELDEVSISSLGTGLEKGQWTSARLVQLYLARIEAIDHNGPQLGSVLALNPDAAATASQLDQERKNGHLRGYRWGLKRKRQLLKMEKAVWIE